MARLSVPLAALFFSLAPSTHQLAAQARSNAQAIPVPVVSSDVDHFWQAYDEIQKTQDPAAQADILKRLFVDKGTPGLTAFMQAKRYTPEKYLKAIHDYPKFWASIRPRTALAQEKVSAFGPSIEKLRVLYPKLRPATIYFEIGCLQSGGTTLEDKVLIGTELATANDTTVTEEFPQPMGARLATFFHSDPLQSLVLTNIHEYVHTQQKEAGDMLLAYSLREGAADFVAQQVLGQMPKLAYVTYGPAHQAEVLEEFRQEMKGSSLRNWLYNNTNNKFGVSDLGYYVGYAFWSAYYQKQTDKKAAIAQMIDLNYSDPATVEQFAEASGFFAPGGASHGR